MVTMSEVARLAGVSQTTVSHVINKTRKVLPETERVVLEAIESTGYAADQVARSLRRGATGIVGLAMSAISNPYFGDIVHSIEEKAAESGLAILLAETHSDPEIERRAVGHLVSRRVDALVLAASEDPRRSLDLLAANDVPTVLVDRIPPTTLAGFDAVGVVNEEPMARLVDHLAAIGHQRISMVAGRRNLATTEERVSGFALGIRRNRLPDDFASVIPGYDAHGKPDSGAIVATLTTPDPPTALILGNNQSTISTMVALRHLGREAPRDIALVAFDDFPWADYFHPRMTVMSQPVAEIGATAVSMLVERMADHHLPARHQRFEPAFVHRESCGCS